MATRWEYAILTRLSAGLDTKWYVNRVFHHLDNELPQEVTSPEFKKYNAAFDKLHASKKFPIILAALNLLGADGWELIDDMNAGMTGGEGLFLKRPVSARAPAKKSKGKKK